MQITAAAGVTAAALLDRETDLGGPLTIVATCYGQTHHGDPTRCADMQVIEMAAEAGYDVLQVRYHEFPVNVTAAVVEDPFAADLLVRGVDAGEPPF